MPGQEQQDVRDLTRLRVNAGPGAWPSGQSSAISVLEEAGSKLSTVLSDIMGQSGRAILDALCDGESDPERLASRVHRSVHATREQMVAALTAEVREHHRFLLRELLALIDAQERSIMHLEEEIERHLRPFEEQVERCEKITGSVSTSCMFSWRRWEPICNASRIASILAHGPESVLGTRESAGKRLSGRSRQGNRYVRAALVQAAHGVRRSRSYLGFADRAPTWGSGIVGSKNGAEVNERH